VYSEDTCCWSNALESCTRVAEKKLKSENARVQKGPAPLKHFLAHGNGGEEQFITSLETSGHLGPVFRNTLVVGR